MSRQLHNVRFGKTEEAYTGFNDLLRSLIKTYHFKEVLDVGGGAQPQFAMEEVKTMGCKYTVMDISEAELARTPNTYRKIVMDIGGDVLRMEKLFDFVFSRFVAEHVRSARRLHENVFNLLKPGGVAIHFFPTVCALPFIVNKLVPECLTTRLLSRERQERGKFPAYYQWCVGPNKAAIQRYVDLGYNVLEYAGFFGHGYYDSIPPLRFLHGVVREILLRHPLAAWTSFAWVILQRPTEKERFDESTPTPDV